MRGGKVDATPRDGNGIFVPEIVIKKTMDVYQVRVTFRCPDLGIDAHTSAEVRNCRSSLLLITIFLVLVQPDRLSTTGNGNHLQVLCQERLFRSYA